MEIRFVGNDKMVVIGSIEYDKVSEFDLTNSADAKAAKMYISYLLENEKMLSNYLGGSMLADRLEYAAYYGERLNKLIEILRENKINKLLKWKKSNR